MTVTPGVTVIFHHVEVIAQIVDVQKPIHRNVENLHEAAELHHCGNETLEGLPDALL